MSRKFPLADTQRPRSPEEQPKTLEGCTLLTPGGLIELACATLRCLRDETETSKRIELEICAKLQVERELAVRLRQVPSVAGCAARDGYARVIVQISSDEPRVGGLPADKVRHLICSMRNASVWRKPRWLPDEPAKPSINRPCGRFHGYRRLEY